MATFNISVNGTNMGEYKGASAAQALDAFAKDAGYTDDDTVVTQINTEALCNAVTEETGYAVFEDSYGDGVALVNGVSYATYQDLAQRIGKNSWDFKA